MKIKDIALFLDCRLDGDGDYEVIEVAKLEDAGEGSLSFIFSEQDDLSAQDISEIAVVVPEDFRKVEARTVLRVKDPKESLIKVLDELYKEPIKSFPAKKGNFHMGDIKSGRNVVIGDYSVIADDVDIGDSVRIFPHSYVGYGVKIGSESTIFPGCVILDNCIIGENCRILPGTIIGSEGFGYHEINGERVHIPQVGNVIIEDNVEIGANCMVDRATIGSTIIGEGTKVDNSVHIAHNVQIGKNSIIVAQVGIAGSCVVGDNTVIAGQAGIADHITIGDNAVVAAKSGVMRDIGEGEVVFGYPADRRITVMRNEAYFRKLPELFKRVKALEESR